MNTLEAIAARRSIRKFKLDPVSPEALRTILTAGIQAPSGKNRQPWRFVVIQGEKYPEMLAVMRAGIAASVAAGHPAGSADWTLKVMEQAPVMVFIFNPEGLYPWQEHSPEQMFMETVDIQSVGAAIQNMLLAAQDLGLGSLWICDVFSAYEGLCAWLGEPGALIAAIALGYADQSPHARPRKAFDDVVRFA